MVSNRIEIAAISNLPIAEKGTLERQFSHKFWEQVFDVLSKFPVVIFAGNLFIQCPEDSLETVQRRLQLFLDLLKGLHTPTVAVLGAREYSHGHRQFIKKNLREAGVHVLTGSPKHTLYRFRPPMGARSSEKTIGILGFSGTQAGLHPSSADAMEPWILGKTSTSTPADVLDSHLSKIQADGVLQQVIPVVPIPISYYMARVIDRHQRLVNSVITGSGDRNRTETSTSGNIPIYTVTVPSKDDLINDARIRGTGEIKAEDLITRIQIHPRV
ncbi:hypothetical protein KBD71_04095 [Candidatus Woesebacteria bacterium]|nr:hypothetical protein [Candidatus Woesebacteria bacterium]